MRINVRIIAATNADLQRCINDGSFRSDLFYRLAGYLLNVPSLRDRKEDIPLVIDKLIQIYSREFRKSLCSLTNAALELLTNYSWPGNIRELQHEIRRLVLICESSQLIGPALLSPSIRNEQGQHRGISSGLGHPSLNLMERMRQLESDMVQAALRRSNGNQSEAARLLGVSRNGLAIKMRRLGLKV